MRIASYISHTNILYFFLCYLLLFTQISFGQSYSNKDTFLIDSLEYLDLSKEDSLLIEINIELYHQSEDSVKLVYLEIIADEALNSQLSLDYLKVIRAESFKLLNKSQDSILLKKYAYSYGASFYTSAFINHRTGKLSLVVDEYQKALDIFLEYDLISEAGFAYNALGYIQIDLGLVNEGIENYKRSLAISQSIDDYYGSCVTLINIAQTNAESEQFNNTFEYLEEALLLSKKHGFKNLEAIVLRNLANYAFKSGERKNFIVQFQESIELSLEEKDYRNACITLNMMASNHFEIYENIDQADSILTLAESYADKIQFAQGKANSEFKRGTFYLKVGNKTSAKNSLVKAFNLFSEGGDQRMMSSTSEFLIDLYREEKNWKKLSEHAEYFYKYELETNSNATKLLLSKEKIAFAYDKQKEIDDLENQQRLEIADQEKKRTKMGMIFAAVLASLIALVSIYIFKQKKELDSAYEQLEESKKNELAVSNLKALQSQMNPHFIFNALNSVQDLVLLQDIRNSNKYLGKFSDLIRKILLSSKEQFISLAEEVEILRLYLDLEKLRFGEDFEIDFKCEVSEEKQEEILLPAMFIQPYIENAIKHGLFHKQGLKKLKVYFSLKHENQLECIVEDNGIGQEQAAIFKEKRLHLHTGFSTEAINERIRLLNETLEKKIELKIVDLVENEHPIGTKIIITFPL